MIITAVAKKLLYHATSILQHVPERKEKYWAPITLISQSESSIASFRCATNSRMLESKIVEKGCYITKLAFCNMFQSERRNIGRRLR